MALTQKRMVELNERLEANNQKMYEKVRELVEALLRERQAADPTGSDSRQAK